MSLETQSTAAAAIAGTSGTAAFVAMLGEITTQILGVPIPVVLAAITGAWIARSYSPAANFFSALMATTGWTCAGCILAPFTQALLGHWWDLKLQTNGLAGLALIVSAGLPLLFPVIAEQLPNIARTWLDKVKGGGQKHDG